MLDALEDVDGIPVAATHRPESLERLATLLIDAGKSGEALVPACGRSKLHWGNAPRAKQVSLLDLAGLGSKIDLDVEEGIVTVGASTPVEALQTAAREVGKTTWLDGLYPHATVGGTIATHPLRLEAQMGKLLRDDVLGLEVMTAGGTRTRCGGRVVKNVSGFDLTRLYCGAWGTLGLVTEATLRLRPLPDEVFVRQEEFPDWKAAFDTAFGVLNADPDGLALWSESGAVSMCSRYETQPTDGGDRVDAHAWDIARKRMLQPPENGAARVRIAGRMTDVIEIRAAVAKLVGDQRIVLVLPALGAVYADIPAETLGDLFARADDGSWSVFIEAAEPGVKARFDVFGHGPESLRLMRALKTRFDPQGVLSPGRFVGRI